MTLVRLINSIKQRLDDVLISGGQDTVGVTEAVEHEDCLASLEEAATRYQSLLQHAQAQYSNFNRLFRKIVHQN